MIVSSVTKQFCIHGHDTYVCGRSQSGNCHTCDQIRWKKSHEKRKSLNVLQNRQSKLLRRYVMTSGQYEELFRLQLGRCGICGIDQNLLTKRLAIDHDHKTNKVRGLLCTKCNLILGFADDNASLLKQASNYLSK